MDIFEQLKRDEGYRQFPYVDTVGKTSIGVGFNLTDVGLYTEEIEFILKNRVLKVQTELSQYVWYTDQDEVRRGVLENMGYNMGVATLLHFPSMIHFFSIKDYVNAAAAMEASVWFGQVGPRAVRLKEQTTSGAWQ